MKLLDFLFKLFRKEPSKDSSAGASALDVTNRIRRAADAILENENLTAGLEDAPAKALTDWGVSCAKSVALGTAGLNDEQAEEALSSGLRATRQLMRSVSDWLNNQPQADPQASLGFLEQIVAQMAMILGPGFAPPDEAQRQAFLQQEAQLVKDPARRIAVLRALFEQNQEQ